MSAPTLKGRRPRSEVKVYFGGQLIAADTGSYGSWKLNSFNVLPTSASETLEFLSVNIGGRPSYGTEIMNVSPYAAPDTQCSSRFPARTWARVCSASPHFRRC